MGDETQPLSTIVSFLLAGVLLYLAWRKRQRQFGSPRDHVKVYSSNRPFRCHLCDGDVIQKREGLLNTTFVTFWQFGFFNESAHCLTCNSCGYVHWFAQRRGANPEVYIRYETGLSAPPGKAP